MDSACRCPTPDPTVDLTFYQTKILIDLNLGYCTCPQGTLSDPDTQQLLTYNADFSYCNCPSNPPDNEFTQIQQYYDSTLQYCKCYQPAVALGTNQWALVWNAANLLCECPNNAMFWNSPTKRFCVCTTVDIAPVGTVKPSFNEQTQSCECPAGTNMDYYDTKVCLCPEGYNWDT